MYVPLHRLIIETGYMHCSYAMLRVSWQYSIYINKV